MSPEPSSSRTHRKAGKIETPPLGTNLHDVPGSQPQPRALCCDRKGKKKYHNRSVFRAYKT